MDTVDGRWVNGRFAKLIGRWLPLTDGDADTWKRIRKWFDANRPEARSTGLLDVAQLLRFRPR
ncbi:MAG: hypothetical protein ABFS86_11000 [Planctomycetota bacterium]